MKTIALACLTFLMIGSWTFDFVRTAGAQGATSPVARGKGQLSLRAMGMTIDEGVGYGGIRVGGTEADVQRQGGEPCDTQAGRPCLYFVSDDSPDGETLMLGIAFTRGAVEWISVSPVIMGHSSHGSPPWPPAVRTRAGIGIGASLDDVRKAYGKPETDDEHVSGERSWLYVSRGVGFVSVEDHVGMILVFKPGTRPNLR